MQSPDLTVEFTEDQRRRAAKNIAEFTPEEQQRAAELYATIAELEARQDRLLAAVQTANKRTVWEALEREARAIGMQNSKALAEMTAIFSRGIERATTREEAPI